jgi:hypothetical protein
MLQKSMRKTNVIDDPSLNDEHMRFKQEIENFIQVIHVNSASFQHRVQEMCIRLDNLKELDFSSQKFQTRFNKLIIDFATLSQNFSGTAGGLFKTKRKILDHVRQEEIIDNIFLQDSDEDEDADTDADEEDDADEDDEDAEQDAPVCETLTSAKK